MCEFSSFLFFFFSFSFFLFDEQDLIFVSFRILAFEQSSLREYFFFYFHSSTENKLREHDDIVKFKKFFNKRTSMKYNRCPRLNAKTPI